SVPQKMKRSKFLSPLSLSLSLFFFFFVNNCFQSAQVGDEMEFKRQISFDGFRVRVRGDTGPSLAELVHPSSPSGGGGSGDPSTNQIDLLLRLNLASGSCFLSAVVAFARSLRVCLRPSALRVAAQVLRELTQPGGDDDGLDPFLEQSSLLDSTQFFSAIGE